MIVDFLTTNHFLFFSCSVYKTQESGYSCPGSYYSHARWICTLQLAFLAVTGSPEAHFLNQVGVAAVCLLVQDLHAILLYHGVGHLGPAASFCLFLPLPPCFQ